jgi:hypothetical protein
MMCDAAANGHAHVEAKAYAMLTIAPGKWAFWKLTRKPDRAGVVS